MFRRLPETRLQRSRTLSYSTSDDGDTIAPVTSDTEPFVLSLALLITSANR
jgi:hypothetical protein